MRRAAGSRTCGAPEKKWGDGMMGVAAGGMGACDCDPSRESSRKAHVRHLGAGIMSVPRHRYKGRSSGSCLRLGHTAHSATHHGYWG